MSYIPGLKIRTCANCGMLNRDDSCTACRKPLESMAINMLAYLGGHNTDPRYRDEFNDALLANAESLIRVVNSLLQRLLLLDPTLATAQTPLVTSGWRPVSYNLSIGGAKNSNHCKCLAVDLLDPEHKMAYLLMKNEWLLSELGLAIEHPSKTEKPTGFWLHVQIGAPASGRRVFFP